MNAREMHLPLSHCRDQRSKDRTTNLEEVVADADLLTGRVSTVRVRLVPGALLKPKQHIPKIKLQRSKFNPLLTSPQSLSPSHCHVSGMHLPDGQRTLKDQSSNYNKILTSGRRTSAPCRTASPRPTCRRSRRSRRTGRRAAYMQMLVVGQRMRTPRQSIGRPGHVVAFSSLTVSSWQSL
ncbi:hypothetical protein PFISCL1PPCAC_21388 [Pristionchus fissidentatus]|uniref:Ribosomal protein n=1 Tax=Pristionchus fissidentatus TaxID=1538716 RepID=A0AAV5WCU0_9BILA|nr:hypothetical protein PFISCL1PPCAC_21379 [Pristionchus fissidentatus]GMT30091.1 hypothetical protein PFISCL1PPCAC_21388 [Pristionchus fissidentatus]